MISADAIAACLARGTFRDSLVVVDRCLHLGDEADLLVVHRSLRYIDVEVKVSRADLKADRRKAKWYHPQPWWRHGEPEPPRVARDWPRSVWKHYYAMPAAIWKDELLEHCGRVSGILLVEPRAGLSPRHWPIRCVRPAKPDRTAQPASAADVVAVARLASLRMWDAYADAERWRREASAGRDTNAGTVATESAPAGGAETSVNLDGAGGGTRTPDPRITNAESHPESLALARGIQETSRAEPRQSEAARTQMPAQPGGRVK